MKAERAAAKADLQALRVQVRTLRTAGLEAAERGERRNLRLARIVVARWHGRTMLMCFKAWREEMVAARGRVAEAAAEALRSRLAMVALLRWRLRDVHFAFAQWRRRASQRKSEAKAPLTCRRWRPRRRGAAAAAQVGGAGRGAEPLPAAAPTASPRSPRRPVPPGPTSPSVASTTTNYSPSRPPRRRRPRATVARASAGPTCRHARRRRQDRLMRSSTPTRGVADLLNVSPRRAKREARRWLEAFSLPGASPRTPGGRQVAWLDGLFGETPGGSKRVDSPWNPFGETPKRDDSNPM